MTGGNGSPPRPGWGQLLHALDGYSDWALPGLLFFLYLESGDRDFLILLGAYLYYNGGGKLLGK